MDIQELEVLMDDVIKAYKSHFLPRLKVLYLAITQNLDTSDPRLSLQFLDYLSDDARSGISFTWDDKQHYLVNLAFTPGRLRASRPRLVNSLSRFPLRGKERLVIKGHEFYFNVPSEYRSYLGPYKRGDKIPNCDYFILGSITVTEDNFVSVKAYLNNLVYFFKYEADGFASALEDVLLAILGDNGVLF